jgi:CubicO group peptidase (beta-lactamase class C family)
MPRVAAALLVVGACSPRTDAAPPPAAAPVSATAAAPPDTLRAARVLAGLRGPVEVAGRPPVRWTLAERMAHYHVPGVSIAVIEDGRVAWARGAGVAEAGTGRPVTPATLFQAASISKPVSATAMLRLVERGTLELDADVNRYLTSWKVPDNRFTAAEKVTLRRLASHTAGLTVHGFPGYAPTDPIPSVVQVLDGAPPANTGAVVADTFPGAVERYSGGGTVVMQQLLVDVTGKPFPELMRELVLAPAGMTRSTFEQPLPGARAGEAARAHDEAGAVLPGGWQVYPEMAPAGLWTTPTDLARWAVAVADARAGRPGALLSPAMAAQMLAPVKGEAGLGPFVGGTGRAFHFGHGGVNAGFISELRMYPELGVGAVVMANGDGAHLLLREIQLALAAEYGWPDVGPTVVRAVELSPAAAAGLAGEYVLQVGPGIPAEVRLEGGRLTLHAPQIPAEELVPESDTRFVMAGLAWRVEFARDASGRATGMTVVRDNGQRVRATRKP